MAAMRKKSSLNTVCSGTIMACNASDIRSPFMRVARLNSEITMREKQYQIAGCFQRFSYMSPVRLSCLDNVGTQGFLVLLYNAYAMLLPRGMSMH